MSRLSQSKSGKMLAKSHERSSAGTARREHVEQKGMSVDQAIRLLREFAKLQ